VNEDQRRSIELSLAAARESLRKVEWERVNREDRVAELLRGILVLAINVTETLLC
jgi:hypothetical protein